MRPAASASLLLLAIAASVVLAHAINYRQPIAALTSAVTVDGTIGSSEWGEATVFQFGNNRVTAYVKGDFATRALYFAFDVSTPDDNGAIDFCAQDYVNVTLDWPHVGGATPGQNHRAYTLHRPCTFPTGGPTEESEGTGLGWATIPGPYAWNAIGASGQNSRWTAEFSIPLPGDVQAPQQVTGARIEVLDKTLISGVVTDVYYLWPDASPRSNPSQWGDLTWGGTANGGKGLGVGDHDWSYDPDSTDMANELLHIIFNSGNEDMQLNSIDLTSVGSADPSVSVQRVVFVLDVNGNLNYDQADVLLGTGVFQPGNAALTINVANGGLIPMNTRVDLLIGVEMSPNAEIGKALQFNVPALRATGRTSGVQVNALAVPIASARKTIRASNTTGGAGGDSPQDHAYTPGVGSADNVMLQLKVRAGSGSAIAFERMKLSAYGTGDERGIKQVKLVRDLDSDGMFDAGEPVAAAASYVADNGTLVLDPDPDFGVLPNQLMHLLVVYEMTNNTRNGDTFAFNVTELRVTNAADGSVAQFNLPIRSATKTVVIGVPGSCSGTVTLGLQPNPVNASGNVSVAVGGLQNCAGLTASLRKDSCSGDLVRSCILGAAGSCSSAFEAPSSDGSYIYYACVDKNADGKFGAGEADLKVLRVLGAFNACSQSSLAACLTREQCLGSNGNWCPAVGGGVCTSAPCPSEACSGTVSAQLSKQESGVGEQLTVSVSGLSSCSGWPATVHRDSCSGETVASCALSDDRCSAAFSAPGKKGNYSLAVCFDKNRDGAFGAGESVTLSLTVTEAVVDLTWLIIVAVVIIGLIAVFAVVERLLRERPEK
ncbi:hypothetical protein HYS54_03355 [Candidatus Micrarchaeota archaeon]|nr:hypothetical protein [Candidatus Micrarchaeota archaeon]